ncbi:MAG TPA: VWA domain-containing protein [Candidatus Aminicenantes bacterium]|mgnify:CR=1 FL=1|nr:VWA domain-containing protein [Candidatus Aminicenantes bacterium]
MQKTLVIIILLLGLNWAAPAQGVKVVAISLEDFPTIRLTLSVEDNMGLPVPVDPRGLKLFEKDRAISEFSVRTLDEVEMPVYAAIVLDKSGSMKGAAIARARDGAAEFVVRMKERDHSAFVRFDTQVEVVSEFTPERGRLEGLVRETRTGSDTALLDGVYQGLELFVDAPEESVRAALVLTDGKENRSRHTVDEVTELAKKHRVSIFTIGLGTGVDEVMLKQLAADSGGRYFAAAGPEVLVEIYTTISTLLHARLVVTYETPFAMDDAWHEVRIEIPRGEEIIVGSRSYLSAKESRIPTEKLREIEAGRRSLAQQQRQQQQARERAEQKRRRTLLALGGAVILLLLVLVTVVIQRRRR